ncbi:MAG: hypothetical protein AB8B91_14745 [Rubripirellula sp.]
MLTVTEPTVATTTQAAQIETLPSDAEISRRVLRIRSQWSVSERLQRKRDADERFADLMCKLGVDVAA